MFVSRMLLLGGGKLNVANVFDLVTYTGNVSTQSVSTAFQSDLAILKRRDSTGDWGWFDSERGATELLSSNATTAEATDADTLTAFNLASVDLGADTKFNASSASMIGMFFKKEAKFFDVVTYTGDGVSGRTLSHDLEQVPGLIIIKRRDSTGDWIVYHRSNTANPETDYLEINNTAGTVDDSTLWNDTAPSSTEFTVGNGAEVNASGGTYVAYLFAHDDSPIGIIQCGGYTGTGTAGNSVSLGWEPQWVMIKEADGVSNWEIIDSVRGEGATDNRLLANLTNAEITGSNSVTFTSTGFDVEATGANDPNASGSNYIYMAIKAES